MAFSSGSLALLRRLVAYCVDDFLPALEVGRHHLADTLRRRCFDVEAELSHLLLDLGQPERGAQLVAPGVDQRRRRPGRGEEDVPPQDLQRGIAELLDRKSTRLN